MAPIFIIALSFIACSMVSAHPFAVDNSTLLANGQDAQVLNAEFADLKSTDPCNDGETACIKNSFATCNGTSWETQRCPSGKQCFALPLIRGNGTFVACTSPNNAQSIISATGAKGGVVSTASSNVTVPFSIANSTSSTDDDDDDDDDCSSDDDDDNDNGQGDGTPDDSGDDSTTITITITLPASGSVTLPTETQTLPPAEASSLISSLTAGGSFSIVTVIPASSAASSSATAGPVSAATGDSRNGAANASAPIPTTIFLTPRPKSATATPTSSSTSGEYAGY